jgi:type II secretory pathway pseudopilin PulG
MALVSGGRAGDGEIQVSKLRRPHQAGFSLVMTLVAVAIAGIVAVVISRVITNGQQGIRSVELRGDLESIRQVLMTQIDCQGTFDKNGITDANLDAMCKTGDDDVQKTGDTPLVLYRDTTDGPKRLIKGALEADGSIKFGSWWLRATCSKAGSSLVVRAARKTADGKSFAKDPLTGAKQDWSSGYGLVIGATVAPVCFTKGLMTGELNYASRTFDWDPSRAPGNKMKMGNTVVAAGSDARAFYQPEPVSKDADGNPLPFVNHGIGCKSGYKILSCTLANALAVTDEVIRAVASDPNKGFAYDMDTSINPQTNTCWTNDPDQIRDAKTFRPAKVALHAVCVKVR